MVHVAQFAFIFPSGSEMIVVLIVGIMLFGRRLPQVGRKVAQTVVQLRQGFYRLKAEMDLDDDVREIKRSFRETRDDLTQAAEVPRGLRDPGGMLSDLTDEALSSVVPAEVLEDVPHALFDSENGLEASAGETAAGLDPAVAKSDDC